MAQTPNCAPTAAMYMILLRFISKTMQAWSLTPKIPLARIMNSFAEKSIALAIIFGIAMAKNSPRPVVNSDSFGQNSAS